MKGQPPLSRAIALFERLPMLDIILIAVGMGFLALSVFYTVTCDRL